METKPHETAGTASAESLVARTDRELLDRFMSEGSHEAFALLVRRHGGLVFRMCERILRDRHDAEDAFQAAFLVLARRPRSIRRAESLSSWLCGVATRVALRLKAKRTRRRGREVVATSLEPAATAAAAARHDAPNPLEQFPSPTGRACDPAAAACGSEDHAVLAEELGRLPDKYRATLIGHYFDGKTSEEVARHLGCPLGTVKARLCKARDLLRARLSRRGVVVTGVAIVALLDESTAGAVLPV